MPVKASRQRDDAGSAEDRESRRRVYHKPKTILKDLRDDETSGRRKSRSFSPGPVECGRSSRFTPDLERRWSTIRYYYRTTPERVFPRRWQTLLEDSALIVLRRSMARGPRKIRPPGNLRDK